MAINKKNIYIYKKHGGMINSNLYNIEMEYSEKHICKTNIPLLLDICCCYLVGELIPVTRTFMKVFYKLLDKIYFK